MTSPVIHQNSVVSLREITQDTLRSILRLQVGPEQTQNVAPNAVSLAEALFEPKAWYRAIYADETPVGFMMTFEDPEKPTYYLWRYMIGAEYQGNGFGRRALELLIDRIKQQPNATEMLLSAVPGPHSPILFYERLGFVETGEVDHGENVMKLVFAD